MNFFFVFPTKRRNTQKPCSTFKYQCCVEERLPDYMERSCCDAARSAASEKRCVPVQTRKKKSSSHGARWCLSNMNKTEKKKTKTKNAKQTKKKGQTNQKSRGRPLLFPQTSITQPVRREQDGEHVVHRKGSAARHARRAQDQVWHRLLHAHA